MVGAINKKGLQRIGSWKSYVLTRKPSFLVYASLKPFLQVKFILKSGVLDCLKFFSS